jgi:hypothetical protein
MREVGRALGRGLRVVVRDRHDAAAYLAVSAVTGGVWHEFGRGWAAIAFGLLVFAIVWRGLR